MDLFETARVDPTMPIEDAVRNMVVLAKEGLFDHVGLSECGAETLRRACSVSFLFFKFSKGSWPWVVLMGLDRCIRLRLRRSRSARGRMRRRRRKVRRSLLLSV